MDSSRSHIKELSLCLSGGGSRGAFHIGVLAYLDENDIRVKAISGTSIGALIASSYASGVKPEKLFQIISSKAFKDMIRFNIKFRSLLKLKLNDDVVKNLLLAENIEELNIPTYVTYVCVNNGDIVYQDSGNIRKYILRSMALFPAFETIKEEHQEYCDGGVLDNLPVKPLQAHPYKILSVNLHPKVPSEKNGYLLMLKRILFLSWHAGVYASIQNSDFYISNPLLSRYNILSFKKEKELYELGYQSAKAYFEAS